MARGAGITGVIRTRVGNLRAAPDFNALIVAQLSQGRELIVSGRTARADWFQVIFDNGTAWVHQFEIDVRGNFVALPVIDTGSPPPPPPPTQPPPPPPGGPWKAEYFANTGMQGRPQLVRQEAAIDYDWGGKSPAPGIPATNWSARWTGQFQFAPGDYTFFASADDGVRVLLDGHAVIDEWQEQSPQNFRNTFGGVSGGVHTIEVQYFNLSGGSSCRVMWQREG